MAIFDDVANEVLNDIRSEETGSHEVFIDPMTLLTIVSVIIQIVKLYRDCKKPSSETVNAMGRPNIFQRRKLKQEVRKAFKEKGITDQAIGPVVDKILKKGKNITEDELNKMYGELG